VDADQVHFLWYDYDTQQATPVGGVSSAERSAALHLMDIAAGWMLLATLTPGGGFQVLDTASLQPVSWSALPAGAQVVSLRFADAATLLILDGGGTLYRTTASEATPLFSCVDFARVSTADNSATIGLFVERAPPTQSGYSLGYYDLAGGQMSDVSSSALYFPHLSDDRRLTHFLEPAANGGWTAVAFDLAERRRIEIGPAAYEYPRFVPGGHDLVFFDPGNDLETFSLERGRTLLLGPVVDFQATVSRKIWFTVATDNEVEGDIEVLTLP
jgi:hypothetical protein